ncbi:MAG: periplasmic heavy metal sensor [Deltaproteobacteria bacterium]|jgi:Spy/CpxP family protein refolding chaperone|nr:MAG: periplasmic heavy metal sensor [Deltaproteobacteria bacterium]TMB20001.1 MAG: periplasmic heavy metal sensor [Deltaproteobacteria bacterium]
MAKKILIALGALALVIGAGAAWAHGPGRHLMMKQMITHRVAEAEDLVQATPQQRAQIDASVNKIIGVLESQRQNRQNVHQQLVQFLTGEKLTTDDINAMAKQHADQMQSLVSQIAPEIVNVHDVLTPAQRLTLANKAKEMHQKHQQNKGGFGGPAE